VDLYFDWCSLGWCSTRDNDVLPYKILIFDDQVGTTSWGQLTSAELRLFEFDVDHVSDWSEAIEYIDHNHIDIVIIDMDLERPENGFDFFRIIRGKKQAIPVILATGNEAYLEMPISQYEDALASGPVMFCSKLSGRKIIDLVREAANRVDPVRRSLSLMSNSGLGEKELSVDGEVYTIDELLKSSERNDSILRGLRESLQALVLEMSGGIDTGRKSR